MSRPKRPMIKFTCKVCGEIFYSNRDRAKYCSISCANKGRKKSTDLKKEEKIKEAVSRENNMKSIKEIAVHAKNAGISYGEYVAMTEVV